MAHHGSTPLQSRFWLEFRIHDDGLDSRRARQMGSRRAAALGDVNDARNHGFSRFPDLPPELRLKVWDYLIAPRVVQIFCLQDDSLEESAGQDHESLTNPMSEESYLHVEPYSTTIDLHRRTRASRIPLILHINRESRTHGLKHYELAFSWKVPHVLAGMDISIPVVTTTTTTTTAARSLRPPPSWSEPRIYFSFARDAVYLAGELEPYDSFGFNSPMTYFLRREDCLRVRHVALAFGALHYGETAGQQIFGALFHVVDRFVPPLGTVLVTVSPADEQTHAMLGGEEPLVLAPACTRQADDRPVGGGGADCDGGVSAPSGCSHLLVETESESLARRRTRLSSATRDNIVQKLWGDWYRGSVVKSRLASMRFELINDWDLASHIEQQQQQQSSIALSSTSSRAEGGAR
ncbi:2EXR family [Microdochium nivale]|nr:2EXR family [Microdochium nivale]